MGKLKVKNWQYAHKSPIPKDPFGLKMQNAILLANAEYKEKERARKIMATDKVAREAIEDVSNLYTDWDLGCAALVMYRKFGHKPEEIVQFLEEIQKLTVEYTEKDVSSDGIWEIVAEEIGIDIKREY